MKKVILFGGSFDPIHWGHYHMANQALRQRGAFELWFIPAAVSPFKTSASHFQHRVRMIEMMISGNDKMKVCTIENELPKPSYSYHTVMKLKEMYPDYQFEWLIGGDHIEQLHKWYEFEKLSKEVQFIVYDRDESHHQYPSIRGELMDISSTAIRQGLQFDTKPAILEYMMRECMYVDEMLKTRLSEFRYEHSLRVVELAKELAIHHNIDLKSVSLAAYMHDYCKENYDDIYFEAGDVHKALYHGFAAASFLSKKYYIKDKHVLKAIESHVSGSGTHPISMILYIADKCERGRNYDSEPLITLAKQDLRKGFKHVKLEAETYRKKA